MDSAKNTLGGLILDGLARVNPMFRLGSTPKVSSILPGKHVVYMGVYATVIYDDGETAAIEAIDGDYFRLATVTGDMVYTPAIEMDSCDLHAANPMAVTKNHKQPSWSMRKDYRD